MKAIFYDRKNKCEVSSEQLMPRKTFIAIEDTWDSHDLTITEFVYADVLISKHVVHTMLNDLVFLRLE